MDCKQSINLKAPAGSPTPGPGPKKALARDLLSLGINYFLPDG